MLLMSWRNMKQTISVEQLNELSIEAGIKFEQWSISKGYGLVLSIGEMIEFINETKPDMHIETHDSNQGTWNLATCYDDKRMKEYPDWSFTEVNTPELADALWSACVEVLNGR